MNPSAVKHLALLLLPLLALGANAARAERADRDKPMRLEADQVSIDEAHQTSTFEGRVQLSQGTMLIRSDTLVVVQAKDGTAHGTAHGHPASFRQKREGSDEYVEGYGDRIEYDSGSETVDFYGNARMKRKQDEVTGDHISYNAKTEIFKVVGASAAQSGAQPGAEHKGRVQVILQPRSAPAPAPEGEKLRIAPSDNLTPPGE